VVIAVAKMVPVDVIEGNIKYGRVGSLPHFERPVRLGDEHGTAVDDDPRGRTLESDRVVGSRGHFGTNIGH
jgi:hypothetical protein